MQAASSTFLREHSDGPPPRCVVVIGPRGAGKTQWVQERIRGLCAEQPEVRCGVVLAEEGRTRMERFAQEPPGVAVRRVNLPCPCCPALADLPGALHQLVADARTDWLSLELPAIAAVALLAELDRAIGWPRQVVVCQGAAWVHVQRRHDPPPFFTSLLNLANTVVSEPATTSIPREAGVRRAVDPD
jgi:hypothetical protein